ncbi:hypothetical protein HFP72_31075 [Nocardiopsis sp. ARC36]
MNPPDAAELQDPVPFGYAHVVDSGTGPAAVAGRHASDPFGQVAVVGFPAQVEPVFEH